MLFSRTTALIRQCASTPSIRHASDKVTPRVKFSPDTAAPSGIFVAPSGSIVAKDVAKDAEPKHQ